jgi:hypothetical protein
LKHQFITKRRSKIHDLDGSGEATPVREVQMELIENERMRVKEKLDLFGRAFKFEQIMLHFVSSH